MPAAPVVAFIIGAVVYLVLAKLGLEGERLGTPQSAGEAQAVH